MSRNVFDQNEPPEEPKEEEDSTVAELAAEILLTEAKLSDLRKRWLKARRKNMR